MQTFFLGFTEQGWDEGKLTQFKDSKQADDYAIEWVSIDAETLEEAIPKYEKAFFDWQVKEGLAKEGDWEEPDYQLSTELLPLSIK